MLVCVVPTPPDVVVCGAYSTPRLVCVVPTPPDVGVCGAYSTLMLVCVVPTPPRGWCVWCLLHLMLLCVVPTPHDVGVCCAYSTPRLVCVMSAYRLNISECTLRLASVAPATQGVLSSVSAAVKLPPQNQ